MLKASASLEHFLRNSSEFDAAVIARDHANCDSLPLRYGVHFERDTPLKLCRARFLYVDYQYSDRFHVEADFVIAGDQVTSGHFVLGSKAEHSDPVVITVWRHDLNTETRLSEVMILLRRKGFIGPRDLLALHPLYINGKVSTHADLVYQLSLKMSSDRVAAMEEEAKTASERADQAIAALEEATRRAKHAEQVALEATYIVDELEEKNMNLSSRVDELKAEVERYKAEQDAARRERNEATLSSPDTLLEVREKQLYRGSSCTILIMSDGTQRHMKTSTFDPYGEVTTKAKSLIGRRVRISCWDPIGQPEKWSSQGYFRNIYAAE